MTRHPATRICNGVLLAAGLGLQPVPAASSVEPYEETIAVEEPTQAALPLRKPPASPQLEEIVVTAQHREQDLQEVPVAVTALGEDFLQERGLSSVQGLGAYAPGLKVQESPGNTTSAQIAIRGSVTINPALYWEPAAAVYLDGVYYGKTQGALFEVADLQRIEVLRGPQGTLYGRNTLAGAINLVTAPPSGVFAGSLKAGLGNYGARLLRGAVDLPAIGDFSVKFNGFLTRRDGMIDVADNPYPQVDASRPRPEALQSMDHRGMRAALRYQPDEALTFDYSYDYSDSDDLPRYGQLARVGSLAPLSGLLPPQIPLASVLSPQQERQRTATIDAESYDRASVQGHALTGTWNPGDVTLKSITAYRELQHEAAGDYDGTQLTLVPGAFAAEYDALSQELQLQGTQGAIDYVGGVFWFRESGATHAPDNGYPPVFGVLELDTAFDFDTRAWAVYGQGDWHWTDSLTLTAGLRYTRERKSLRHHYRLGPGPATVPEGSGGEETFRNLSPTLIAAWQATTEVNLYAKWAQGYKSGGFNGDATTEEAANRPYAPELLDAYELGAKTAWFDRRVIVNLAAFYNRSRDMQLSRFDGGPTLGSTIVNAGKATIWGLELESMAQLTDDLQLRLTYGYLRPRYDQFLDTNPTTGQPEDVSGNRAFPLAPRHTAGAGLDWVLWRLRNGLLQASIDADYSDSYYLYPYALDPDASPSAVHNQGDERTLLNGRLSLAEFTLRDGAKLEFALWGRNLMDEDYVATTLDLGPQLGGINLHYHGDARTVGAELTLRW